MQDGPDLVGLSIFLGFALIIILTLVIFVLGVAGEIRGRFDARRRRIDKRPGFPVNMPQDKPSENRI